MGQKIVIRKSGNLIEVSDSSGELSKPYRDLIEPYLTYTYQQYLRGPDRTDPRTGYKRGKMMFEERRLYRYDALGRFCCGVGFRNKLTVLLTNAGCEVSYTDCDPPHPRTDRFTENWDGVAEHFKFRPKQSDCLLQISTNEFGQIKAPTGFGKGTIIAMGCMLYPNAKIHVITPSKDLVEKTVAILTKYIPMVGQIGAGRKRMGRVTVYSADSLHLSDGDADIIFADEIHKLASPTHSEELVKYKHSRNFGFSATPTGRMDGADAKLESIFGPLIFDLSYQEAVKHKLVVPIAVEWLDVIVSNNPCANKNDVVKKRWGIWRHEERNKIISDKALSYPDEDQVLILVETIEHLLFLRQLLPNFSACYSSNGIKPDDIDKYRRWGLLGADEQPITAKERESLRKKFEAGEIKKAIATSVWATGVDFEQLAVLIRADALGSEIMDTQAPGRVSRRFMEGEKDVGIVVDCLDQFDPTFRKKALGRKNSYGNNGWSQSVPIKVSNRS